jgi:hypothetical protein
VDVVEDQDMSQFITLDEEALELIAKNCMKIARDNSCCGELGDEERAYKAFYAYFAEREIEVFDDCDSTWREECE